MRRYVAIIMLVCANILLFAHSFVAHHHEGAIVTFHNISSNSLDTDQHNSHTKHSHRHHSDAEHFNLNNFTRPETDKKQDINFAILYATLHHLMPSELLISDNEVSYGDYIEHKYHLFSLYFAGLRGPPVC